MLSEQQARMVSDSDEWWLATMISRMEDVEACLIRHYPTESNRAGNTKWTLSRTARSRRAMCVAMMPDILEAFPHDRLLRWHDREQLWREVVRRLKILGLLSPSTSAMDVSVNDIVYDARMIAKSWDESNVD